MKNFKVLVIQHCLKNNQIAEFGDVVSESQLTGDADELVKAGFIEEVAQEVAEAPKAKGKK